MAAAFELLDADTTSLVAAFCGVADLSELRATNKAFSRALRVSWLACRAALQQFPHNPAGAITTLQRLRRLSTDPSGVASFLFESHGRLPAKAIGNYVTAPPRDPGAAGDLEREDVLIEFMCAFDFTADSPPQALRRLLKRTRMPQRTKGAGELFHAAARRYVSCQRAAALPAASAADFAVLVVDATGAKASVFSVPLEYQPRNCYGFDVASLDESAVFTLFYALYILNADLRSSAIKTKMTREQFVDLNVGVESLRHIPAHFFEGLFDEVVVAGFPINDRVPLTAVPLAVSADRKVAAALRPLVHSATAVVRESADVALSWLRRLVLLAASASGAPPLPLYRT